MRNWYGRKYLVICEPIAVRRGRLFERKLAEVEKHGYTVFGGLKFMIIKGEVHGTVLMVRTRKM